MSLASFVASFAAPARPAQPDTTAAADGERELSASDVLESMVGFEPAAGGRGGGIDPADPAPAADPADPAPAPAPAEPAAQQTADVTSVQALFAEARELTTQVARRDADLEAQRLRSLARGVRAAQDRLMADIVRTMAVVVPQAAAHGQRSADVLQFQGADKYVCGADDDGGDGGGDEESYCYLYLVRGPRERVHREELRAMGVHPLLPRIRRELAPFVVRHVWNPATNGNTVSVSW